MTLDLNILKGQQKEASALLGLNQSLPSHILCLQMLCEQNYHEDSSSPTAWSLLWAGARNSYFGDWLYQHTLLGLDNGRKAFLFKDWLNCWMLSRYETEAEAGGAFKAKKQPSGGGKGYSAFVAQEYASTKKEQGIASNEMFKALGQKWKAMSAAEKDKYNKWLFDWSTLSCKIVYLEFLITTAISACCAISQSRCWTAMLEECFTWHREQPVHNLQIQSWDKHRFELNNALLWKAVFEPQSLRPCRLVMIVPCNQLLRTSLVYLKAGLQQAWQRSIGSLSCLFFSPLLAECCSM